ncbi:hypothetical protein EVAR_50691_1 [Eumeta japonica]|uniref:Serine proteinase stubble n=1 Tax=Eumeta variegata TaxID=151549 RepID=A0A4C1XS43_EUMVA|nr:hypothetical protein EVAR_50691_1 [Eumeta japonica]
MRANGCHNYVNRSGPVSEKNWSDHQVAVTGSEEDKNAHGQQLISRPITVARNIRHLPCISRRTRQEGVCMFAIDCIKANGTHLGTCIDRFYFGSCCQIPDKTVLPQIIGNNIDDETIDSNFVHPQTDKVHNVMPESIFPTRKPTTTTTEKVKTTITSMIGIEQKYTTDMESKTDAAMTGIDNKIEDDSQVTTALVNKVTTKIPEEMSKITTVSSTTETPAKLSTFQTVSDEYNKFTTEKNTIPFEEVTDVYSKETSMETTHGESTTTTRKPMATTRIPIRTTTIKSNHKPRPTLKPLNITRPQIHSPTKPLNITSRPKPTKPVSSFNITRPIPPYKLPPKRPTPTKKPIPLPPRLNITILPQSTSVKPVSTTRPSLTTITYINTTTTNEDRPTSTSTTSPSPTTIKTTEKLSTVSLTEPTTTTTTTTSTIKTSTATTSASTVEPLESSSKSTSPSSASSSSTSSLSTSSSTVEVTTRPGTSTPSLTTEKEVKEPATETEQPTTVSKVLSTEKVTTDFPPGLVTWSNTVDATTKSPEVITTSSLPGRCGLNKTQIDKSSVHSPVAEVEPGPSAPKAMPSTAELPPPHITGSFVLGSARRISRTNSFIFYIDRSPWLSTMILISLLSLPPAASSALSSESKPTLDFDCGIPFNFSSDSALDPEPSPILDSALHPGHALSPGFGPTLDFLEAPNFRHTFLVLD